MSPGGAPPARRRAPLWTCPACGERFVTPRVPHSCGRIPLDARFAGSEPAVRELFDALVAAAAAIGPVHAYAQRSRIVLQNRARFVAVTPRRRHLAGHLWLKRPRAHPLVHRVESLLDRDFLHHFRLARATEMDAEFRDLLREAYAVGAQAAPAGGEPPG